MNTKPDMGRPAILDSGEVPLPFIDDLYVFHFVAGGWGVDGGLDEHTRGPGPIVFTNRRDALGYARQELLRRRCVLVPRPVGWPPHEHRGTTEGRWHIFAVRAPAASWGEVERPEDVVIGYITDLVGDGAIGDTPYQFDDIWEAKKLAEELEARAKPGTLNRYYVVPA